MNIRHGDIQIIKCEKIPEDAKFLKGEKVLAYGEVTGHAHRIDVGYLFMTALGELYLLADKLTKVSHEQHKIAEVPKGNYRIGVKRQYDPVEGWTKVED